MKIAQIRFLDTEQPFRAIIDARTIKAAEQIAIEKLATLDRSASFEIIGNAKKADRDSLPTIDEALEPKPTNALDSLAKLATATKYTPTEIAEMLGGAQQGATAEKVQSWIDGTIRPGVETAYELQKWLIHLRARLNQNRRLTAIRDQELAMLAVALQNPTERKLWIAKRAEMRAQFAR